MSDFHGIHCDGCGSIVPIKGKTPELFRFARRLLKERSWERRELGRDFCPKCVAKTTTEQP